MSDDLLERAIAAHGGMELWQSAGEIRVGLSAGGLAFASKLQTGAVRPAEARISTREQHVVIDPYPGAGRRGWLRPDGSVGIDSHEGEPLARRTGAREAFADLRHKLWWDRLDMLYFATYAIWTYISTPFVLAEPGYETHEIDPWRENGERWRRLAVRFPERVDTHSREQVFYYDEQGLLRRHDYTAEPIGRLAQAAHYSFEHRSYDGFVIPTRRRVYPRKRNNQRRAGPLLVWIELGPARVLPAVQTRSRAASASSG
jgi:hypothetical protein